MLELLPDHLAERTRTLTKGPLPKGEFVLYWMCTAIRTDENPALDVARILARHLNVPLLVYQGLSQRYAYASDRHHRFILEAARDFQQQAQELGLSYAFFLESGMRSSTTDDAPRPLEQLASSCAIVVTEDMPTQPQRGFAKALARRHRAKMCLVNTACIVPPQLVGKPYDRAFAYRDRTKSLYSDRTDRHWPEASDACKGFDLSRLDFEPMNLSQVDLAQVIASCEIDHAVGPVLDTIGGSEAGYQRWNRFLDQGIKKYAKQRNNALLDGVSRMSAYLHYGMVSPMRLAREAKSISHAGAEKFLDELLIWRELAYCFCLYRKDHSRWSVLPEWAKETLARHAQDPRPATYSWEQLARGETNDALWNAGQKSLLIHGELHNNVRMTWGKALLNWLPTPQRALQTIIDLNHRYALDGRDPASFGGILWCLGQFDRPFAPEQPILGTVRPRPTEQHAQRLDPRKYSLRTSVSRCPRLPKIAVIGAGLSGSFAARTLQDHGLPVQIFEKSRGAGGRMATRRSDVGDFDHGAQYFTARDPRFRRYVDSWIEQGTAAEWKAPIFAFDQPGHARPVEGTKRFVGTPAMNCIAKHLAKGIPITTEVRVAKVLATDSRFQLIHEDGSVLDEFDRVIVSLPAEQACQLLEDFASMLAHLQSVVSQPCWATMLRLENPIAIPTSSGRRCDGWGGAFVNSGPLRWIARNASKPGRDTSMENLVLHSNTEWAQENLEQDPSWVAAEMLEALARLLGQQSARDLMTNKSEYIRAHRWRYSIPSTPSTHRCIYNSDSSVVACGDWAGGPRVEGAFLSGMSAAGMILNSLERTPSPPSTPDQLHLFS